MVFGLGKIRGKRGSTFGRSPEGPKSISLTIWPLGVVTAVRPCEWTNEDVDEQTCVRTNRWKFWDVKNRGIIYLLLSLFLLCAVGFEQYKKKVLQSCRQNNFILILILKVGILS